MGSLIEKNRVRVVAARCLRAASQLGSWAKRPARGRSLLRDYLAVRRSGEFDRDFYLLTNPDVAAAGLDPLMHYVEHGREEGRPHRRCNGWNLDDGDGTVASFDVGDRGRLGVAIKVPVPAHALRREWGDWHVGRSLKAALELRGHRVRLDLQPDWYSSETCEDDVVIVLRGLLCYEPRPGNVNIMWNISHPDLVAEREYERYEHVFVGSLDWADRLRHRVQVPVSPLLQCTDPGVFRTPNPGASVPHELLFVGNTRGQFRKAVRDAISAGLSVRVFGAGWERFIASKYIGGRHIENRDLYRHYAGAAIVLNDHWPAMADTGFLSNRIFDAAGSGAFVISDAIRGAERVFGDALVTFRGPGDLSRLCEYYLARPEERRRKAERLRRMVLAEHTFDRRCEAISTVAENLVANRMKQLTARRGFVEAQAVGAST